MTKTTYTLGPVYEYGGKRVGDPPGPRYDFRDLTINGITKLMIRDDSLGGSFKFSVVTERYGEPQATGTSWEKAAEAIVKRYDEETH